MSKEELLEKDFKASRGINTVEGPATPAGGSNTKRKADMNKKDVNPDAKDVEDDVKTPQGSNNVKEHIEAMFEGEEFSEEFKEKIAIVFETAVNETVQEQVAEKMEALEEDFEDRIDNSISSELEKIIEASDSYLDIIAENWLKENQIAIESSKKVEMAESFIDGLSYLFKEHNIDIEQEDSNIVEELEEEKGKLKEKVNTLANSLRESYDLIKEFERKEALSEINEGLTETEKERLQKLTESLEYENSEDFIKKASIIKESFFKDEPNKNSDTLNELNEENVFEEEDETNNMVDPSMKGLVEALNNQNKTPLF